MKPIDRRWIDTRDGAPTDQRIGALLRELPEPRPLPPAQLEALGDRLAAHTRGERDGTVAAAWPRVLITRAALAIALLVTTGGAVFARHEIGHALSVLSDHVAAATGRPRAHPARSVQRKPEPAPSPSPNEASTAPEETAKGPEMSARASAALATAPNDPASAHVNATNETTHVPPANAPANTTHVPHAQAPVNAVNEPAARRTHADDLAKSADPHVTSAVAPEAPGTAANETSTARGSARTAIGPAAAIATSGRAEEARAPHGAPPGALSLASPTTAGPRAIPSHPTRPVSDVIAPVAAARAPVPAPITPAPTPAASAPIAPAPMAADFPAPSIAPAAPDPLGAEAALLARAIETLQRRHDPTAALALLDQHRARFPGAALQTSADLVRIDALLALGRRPEAIALIEAQPFAGNPRTNELQVIAGELHAASNDCARARPAFDRALAGPLSAPLVERALRGRAVCCLRQGTDAAADLRAYLARFPDGPLAPTARARLAR